MPHIFEIQVAYCARKARCEDAIVRGSPIGAVELVRALIWRSKFLAGYPVGVKPPEWGGV